MHQDNSMLSPEDLALIRVASEHVTKRYREGLTSIAGALRTKNGKIYTGTNLKYQIRNVSTCGGASAIHAALDDGEKEFDTLVEVKFIPETKQIIVVNACGQCRQLHNYNLPLNIIIDNSGKLEVVSAEQLLPYPF